MPQPGDHQPGDRQPGRGDHRPARAQGAAVRCDLGVQLQTWRERAGLSQQQLADRTGYARSTVGGVENGRHAAREFFQAADAALKAGGRLLAAYDQAAAAIAAIGQQAAAQARATRARAAGLTLAARPTAPATTQTLTCPHCRHVSVMTLTAVPPSPAGVT